MIEPGMGGLHDLQAPVLASEPCVFRRSIIDKKDL
jgi:hypothetical protein